MPRVQRAKQRVVVEPPCVLRRERPAADAARVESVAHSVVTKCSKERRERNLFQLANGAIVDGRKRPHAIERRTKMRLEPLLSADGRKVLDALERDELRIDRHRTQCADTAKGREAASR